MRKRAVQYEMDMTNGPLLMNMLRFALPLMASGVLQLLYNAADMIVVGQFAGAEALASVGATGAITALLVNLFMGFSVGASVVVAQHYGAGSYKDVSQSVHTAVALALICGIGIGIIGVVLARPLLEMMNTPADIIDGAVIYMSIYFAGLPATMLYNFCAALLRAVGDTKRPLYYLMISGAVNVILNLIFVIGFHMSVAGVALATLISQCISMTLIVICLMRSDGAIQLDLHLLRLHRDKVSAIIRIGLPAGLQSSMFAISNTLIHSTVNTFGSAVIAGNTAASNIESFVSMPLSSFQQATMSFMGQNYGARKHERFGSIVRCGVLLVLCLGIPLGLLASTFAEPLIRIYTSEPDVIAWGASRLTLLSMTYFILHIDDVFASGQRGMGSSVFPMLVSIVCICVFRIIWIYTVFAASPDMLTLYYAYPASWAFSLVVHAISFFLYKKRVVTRMKAAEAAA